MKLRDWLIHALGGYTEIDVRTAVIDCETAVKMQLSGEILRKTAMVHMGLKALRDDLLGVDTDGPQNRVMH